MNSHISILGRGFWIAPAGSGVSGHSLSSASSVGVPASAVVKGSTLPPPPPHPPLALQKGLSAKIKANQI